MAADGQGSGQEASVAINGLRRAAVSAAIDATAVQKRNSVAFVVLLLGK